LIEQTNAHVMSSYFTTTKANIMVNLLLLLHVLNLLYAGLAL